MKSKFKPVGYYTKKNFKEAEMEHELGHETQEPTYFVRFGKYKNHRLQDVPVPYLNWVLTTFNETKNKELFSKIRKLLGERP